MKKIILSVFGIVAATLMQPVYAQCDLKDVVIGIVSTNQSGPDCQTVFNLSLKLKNNSGNKTVVVQAWKEADYPAFWGTNCSGNQSPKAADLRLNGTGPLPFLNIAFDIATQAVIASGNYPGGGVTLGSGYTVSVGALDALGYYPISLSNVSVVVPDQQCGNGVTIKADIWSSQGSINSQWTPHCVLCNNLYAFNYPIVNAQLNCLIPRQYFVRIQNINTLQTIESSWKAYRDDNNNGVLDPTDPLVDDQSGTLRTINSGAAYNSGFIAYTDNTTAPAINKNLIIEVTTTGLANKQYALASNGCSPLPVNFKSFTAVRSNGIVDLIWETMTEQQSASFIVERSMGVNGWQPVAEIASQAPGGNSNSLLAYQYRDNNTYKGMTQYRIRQVDLDNRSRFSEIRVVRGEAQPVKLTIYPNPSDNGTVTVVFESVSSGREITLTDFSGKVIRKLSAVSSSSVQLENLSPGIYNLRVTDLKTGVQSANKIVILKR